MKKQKSMIGLFLVLTMILVFALSPLTALAAPGDPEPIDSYNYYYGTFHNHTGYSDATNPGVPTTPADAFTYARDVAHLDFLGLCDHAESLTAEEWDATLAQANAATVDGSFVAMRGFEWTSMSYGHSCVLGSDDLLSSRTVSTLAGLNDWLSTRDCIATLNHPGEMDSSGTEHDHLNTPLNEKWVAMELFGDLKFFPQYYWNTTGYYKDDSYGWIDEALMRGFHLGAGGGFDEHENTWGTATNYRLAILAPSLTRDNLMAGLKARRFYPTSDVNLKLYFDLGGQVMGSTLPTAGTYTATIQAADGDSEAFSKIELLQNSKVIKTWDINENTPKVTFDVDAKTGDYIYCRVKQADGGEAISSSVWVAAPSTAVAPTGLTVTDNKPTSVSLSWTGDASVSTYNIYRSGELIGTTADQTYTDATRPENASVSYYVRGVDAGGALTVASNTVSVRKPPIPVMLGFSGDGEKTDGANMDMTFSKYTATENGTATIQKILIEAVPTGAQVQCAIYADNAGAPGALIKKTEERTMESTDTGWQAFKYDSSVTITKDTVYWLGVWCTVRGFTLRCDTETGNGLYKRVTYATGGWPDPAPTGFSTNNCKYCMYVQNYVPKVSKIIMATDAVRVEKDGTVAISNAFEALASCNTVKLSYTFDKTKFEYASFAPADGVTLLSETPGDGTAVVVVMIPDYKALSLGTLNLHAKTDGALKREWVTINLSADCAVKDEVAKSVVNTKASVKFTTLGVKGDTNGSGTINVLDLSDVIDWFGITSTDAQWNNLYIFYDYNGNGAIDISDICLIAKLV